MHPAEHTQGDFDDGRPIRQGRFILFGHLSVCAVLKRTDGLVVKHLAFGNAVASWETVLICWWPRPLFAVECLVVFSSGTIALIIVDVRAQSNNV